MAKIGIFKKVAALATAIAIVLCFAVSAGAADADITVTTTTSYVEGNDGDIWVQVEIAGEDIVDKSVSYYAFNGDTPVYIDQIEDGISEVSIDYVTDNANLNSDVKVGYTGASAAEDAKVTGNTVTWGDAVAYIPTEATDATVVFATEATDVVSYSATGATISAKPIASEGFMTVILTGINGPVVLTIETQAQATAKIIDAAFVVSNGSDDIAITDQNKDVVDTAWQKHVKLTAIGKVTGVESDYGVIVCEKDATYTADDKFQAVAKTESGHFAVQLIDDNSDDATFINRNKQYDVRAYAASTDSEKVTVSLVDLTAKKN